MNRRGIINLLTVAAAAVAASGRRAAAAEAQNSTETAQKMHGVVLHVGQNDPVMMNIALNNAANAIKLYAERGAQVAVEIVANGPGLHIFRDDTSPLKARLKEFHDQLPQVVLSGCSITKAGMESAEGKTIALVPEARLVPSGIVRLMELQEQGWSYAWA